jgi:predicted RND superfamily exporter protein
MSTWFAAIARFVLHHRRPCALGLFAVFALTVAGAARLGFDLSSKAFYGDGDAATAALDRLHERWGHDDATVVVVVDAPDPDGVLTAPRIDAIRAISDELRALPEVVRVDALTDHPASAAVAGGSRPARAWLHTAPLVPLLMAADERTAAIAVALRFSSDDLPPTVAAVDAIASVVAAHDGVAGLQLRTGGLPVIRAGFARATLEDQRVLVPACLAMVAFVLWLAFRRGWQVLVPLALALVPTAMLAGVLGWAGEPIGLLNQGYFTLLPVIAVADGIHLVSRVAELGKDATDREGRERAIVDASARVGLACLLTSATTAVGFGSLFTSSMPMLRSFGGWAALGVMLAFAVLLVLGPLLLATVRDLGPAGTHGARDNPRSTASGWLARWTAVGRRRPAAVLVVACGVTVGMLWIARDVPVDNRLSDLLDAGHPAARASAEIDARLGGVLSVELEIAGPAGHWDEPTQVQALAAFEGRVAALPDVRAVLGPGVLLRASGSEIGRDAATMQRAWRRLDEIGLRAGVLDDARGIAHVAVRVPDIGGERFEALVAEIVREAESLDGVEVTAGGTAALAYRGVNRIAEQLRSSLIGAFAVITVAVAVGFGSVRAGLASIVPNAIPLLLGYAIIALWVGRFDPLGGIVLAVALGIAVDDTIHLIGRTREAQRGGAGIEAALAEAVARSGLACGITSVVLAAGLALFGLSSFPPLRLLGGLGATVILVALLCDLYVLPAVMMLLSGRETTAPVQPPVR